MIDLHTHTLFSDGELVPAELTRRADRLGYRWIAITDHVDGSTLEHAIRGAVAAAAEVARYWKIRVLPGAELTHNPPELLPELIREARRMGAKVVVVHGETIVEPVPGGDERDGDRRRVRHPRAPGADLREGCAPGGAAGGDARDFGATRTLSHQRPRRRGRAGRGGEPGGQQRRPQPGRPDRAGNRGAGSPAAPGWRNGRLRACFARRSASRSGSRRKPKPGTEGARQAMSRETISRKKLLQEPDEFLSLSQRVWLWVHENRQRRACCRRHWRPG